MIQTARTQDKPLGRLADTPVAPDASVGYRDPATGRWRNFDKHIRTQKAYEQRRARRRWQEQLRRRAAALERRHPERVQ